jgi:thiamine-phosphate pyrophosphorylase
MASMTTSSSPSKALPRVLAFTDAAACRVRGRGVVDTIARMLDDVEGSDVAVVVRDKAATRTTVDALCRALRPITARAGARLLVHTHAELVRALDLDGVHLGGRADVHAVRAARLRLPPGALVGVSRHVDDRDDTGALRTDGADYATLSPIFSPTSKASDQRPTLGTRALAGHRVAVFALGGVDVDNAAACVAAGAAGVAVIGALMSAVDPRRALRGLLAATTTPG